MNTQPSTPLFIWLYRLACYLLAAVCMIYMTINLAEYLQVDPMGYLPSVGQWLIGLFFCVLLFVNRRGWLQSLRGCLAKDQSVKSRNFYPDQTDELPK